MSTNNNFSNREDIYIELKNIMHELFGIDKNLILLESDLYHDLDIDSIDAVDMMAALKKATGKKIQPSTFKQVRTINDVVEAVNKLLNEN